MSIAGRKRPGYTNAPPTEATDTSSPATSLTRCTLRPSCNEPAMSLLPELRYNIQSHGWDYNIGVNDNTLLPAASPQYTWQLSTCAKNNSQLVYIAETASRTCLSGNITSGTVVVKPCEEGDGIWDVTGDGGTNTYKIQLIPDAHGNGAEGFLFLANKTFGLGNYGAGGSRSEFEWAFRVGEEEVNLKWDVCEYVTITTTSGSGC
ncbi:hypothetical protein SVAN01_01483 [Stagonosporopsis vannaccii]|nr:hypothetical protein SVAN01_01483 [Stagonosporopsis vannaccii]